MTFEIKQVYKKIKYYFFAILPKTAPLSRVFFLFPSFTLVTVICISPSICPLFRSMQSSEQLTVLDMYRSGRRPSASEPLNAESVNFILESLKKQRYDLKDPHVFVLFGASVSCIFVILYIQNLSLGRSCKKEDFPNSLVVVP